MRTRTRKASLPMRITRLLLPTLEFPVEVYWNPRKIKFQNNSFIKSRDFWVSRRSWSYTAATHKDRRSWRTQDCPALKMKTLRSVKASASDPQRGTSRTTWITGWPCRRIWMLMTLFPITVSWDSYHNATEIPQVAGKMSYKSRTESVRNRYSNYPTEVNLTLRKFLPAGANFKKSQKRISHLVGNKRRIRPRRKRRVLALVTNLLLYIPKHKLVILRHVRLKRNWTESNLGKFRLA